MREAASLADYNGSLSALMVNYFLVDTYVDGQCKLPTTGSRR